MKAMFAFTRGVLTLNTQTFADLKSSPDVFRKGFTVLLVVGLIVGLVVGIVAIIQGLTTDPLVEMQKMRANMQEYMSMFMPAGSSKEFLDNFEMGLRIGERIAREAKAPLPRPVQVIFQQIGAVVSFPFNWLGSLLFYGAWVHLFAKLLGGKGTIGQMYGLTSLAVVPHLLDAFSWIPCLAQLLGLISWGWGIAVYVKATSVAQEMTMGKATLAALLPAIVSILLGILFTIVIIVLNLVGGGR